MLQETEQPLPKTNKPEGCLSQHVQLKNCGQTSTSATMTNL